MQRPQKSTNRHSIKSAHSSTDVMIIEMIINFGNKLNVLKSSASAFRCSLSIAISSCSLSTALNRLSADFFHHWNKTVLSDFSVDLEICSRVCNYCSHVRDAI